VIRLGFPLDHGGYLLFIMGYTKLEKPDG
jgi:hypothetical protein